MSNTSSDPILRDLTRFERPPLELVDAQPFDLASNFAPSGDQPNAIEELTSG